MIKPIGVIYSPFMNLENMPIQPSGAADVNGLVVVDQQFEEGLADLDGFSHLYLIYHLHKADRTELTVVPFLDQVPRGVFATRSPLRPNHIGISIVELINIEGCRLLVKGVDILDGTPLFDIKPYVAPFDRVDNSRSGWIKAQKDEISEKRSDNRFV
jgi:tRNA (adenine37-N6)-methyltransferase